ncbi:hypothetical protein GGR54DRAFT_224380 [Hypoxylon sp. NC1633]|nr:hypothetical protein GGR54DRAFT_224380 [Hypoxylon sp. NC1633]
MMFRRLWAGSRAPAASFSCRPWLRWQSRRRPFFSQRTAFLHRSSRPRQSRTRALLYASAQSTGIYGTIFISFAMLVTDDSLWKLTLDVWMAIDKEKDMATKIERYWKMGRGLLETYSGAQVEDHGRMPPEPGAVLGENGELHMRLMTAPDPDFAGGTVFLFQAVVFGCVDAELSVGETLHNTTVAALPMLNAFATGLGRPARGVTMVYMPNENDPCKVLYFDGKRWINVVAKHTNVS